MDFKHIKYEVQKRIALITLNRPDQMNAWTVTMMNELIEALGIAEADDHIRVVVVTGAGRAFCAGADLSAGGFNVNPENEGKRTAHRDTAGRATLVMYDMKKPIIAAINGPAVGVGMTMTLAMDVRIAADNVAKMGFIFNRRGIVPEGCSTFFLPRIVGISLAAELILTGRLFSSSEALDMGLVSRIVPAEALLETAMGLADEIAENTSAISTALARQMLWKGLGQDHPMAAHILESKGLDYMFAREDCREGVMSFLEKRPARFSMRPSTDMPEYYPWWQEHCFKV
ncbi:MAG: enoyl-CoA hydratase/isomerase family protein [Deltaproteobacteria bacterium]|nr:enoyl-CoA hydratase/isomerase family protein [Deltaproteobacteria bacterium]MBW2298103.1 enoyl-CoA hydratase/isomerase family protein [Deltaproteobacteria bacterium]